jgi:hypothetical protein
MKIKQEIIMISLVRNQSFHHIKKTNLKNKKKKGEENEKS